MINKGLVNLLLIPAAIAVATWLIGWWAVPIAGLAGGLMSVPSRYMGLAAGLSWAVLLLIDVSNAAFARLAGMLSEVMGVPVVALIALTILFPMILGWSAATVGNAMRSIRPAEDRVHHLR